MPGGPERVTYYVLGTADSADFAKAEALATLLQARLPSIDCEAVPVTPADWSAEYDSVCRQRSFAPAKALHPLVWTGTGALVGDLAAFRTECRAKYSVELADDALPWAEIAKENMAAHTMLKEGSLPTAQLAPGAPGAAVCEELLAGHERYRSGVGAGASLRAVDGVAATALVLNPVEVEPRVLFDQPEDAVFVVPCVFGAIDDLTIGNLEHGALTLHARALAVIGSDSPELRVALRAAQARLAMRDEPLPQAVAEAVDRMMPAMLRVLAVATPDCDEAELLEIALEEYVREACDELLRASPLLAELFKRGKFDILRLAYAPGRGLWRV